MSKPLYDPIDTDELIRQMKEIFEYNLEAVRTKGHDYASLDLMLTGDSLGNVGNSLGWVGAMVRAQDKMKRIQTMYTSGKLNHESLEDAFRDLLNYAFYGYILWKNRNYDVKVTFTEVGEVVE